MNIKFRGFTLIELMVVISIIGVMSTIVLASLSLSKSKGADAAIKSNLSTIQQQAETYYLKNNYSYGQCIPGTCPSCATVNATNMFSVAINPTIAQAIAAANSASGGTAICNSSLSPATWTVSSPLKMGGWWCVDSTGASKSEAASHDTSGATYKCL